MLNVIICDDDMKMVNNIRGMIENAILIKDIKDVNIELATRNPEETLGLFRIKKHDEDGNEKVTPLPLKQRLLFLDINYGPAFDRLDGVRLGCEIREYDIGCNIVFVTNSGDEKSDVINEKITPLGYLPKRLTDEQLKEKIVDLLETARKRMYMTTMDRKMIQFKTGHSKKYANLADIYYIKGNESKNNDEQSRLGLTVLCEAGGIHYLKRKLKFYDEHIPELIRLGRSYLVNPLNVRETKTSGKRGILKLANGEEISVRRESLIAFEEISDKMREKGLL